VSARKAAAILVATDHGPMILNRLDYQSIDNGGAHTGVACTLLERSIYGEEEVDQLIGILEAKRRCYGAGVVAIDGGANIGVHTISFARAMVGWGSVHAFEPQERIFYMLAGNVALNNLLNARVYWVALGKQTGSIQIPLLDYEVPANFGGLNLRPRACFDTGWDIGQPVDSKDTVPVAMVRIDDLRLPRVDLIKLDVEGMEAEALAGAQATLARCHPVIFAEQFICGGGAIRAQLPPGYVVHDLGGYVLAVHEDDKIRAMLNFTGKDATHSAVITR
jgi:FkbM family methyltransferase